MALFGTQGQAIRLHSYEPSTLLVLSGVPIEEPIVGYGPFVMNSRQEIISAFDDLQSGRFGILDS
jgi:quercetin 2,3-dioxygenase